MAANLAWYITGTLRDPIELDHGRVLSKIVFEACQAEYTDTKTCGFEIRKVDIKVGPGLELNTWYFPVGAM